MNMSFEQIINLLLFVGFILNMLIAFYRIGKVDSELERIIELNFPKDLINSINRKIFLRNFSRLYKLNPNLSSKEKDIIEEYNEIKKKIFYRHFVPAIIIFVFINMILSLIFKI